MRTGGLRRLGLSAGIVIAAFLVVAYLTRPGRAAGPCTVIDGPAPLPEIPEASGLAVSRRNPGVLWAHNDSGHATVLFALDAAGRVAGRVQVPVNTRDWEDVSAGRCSLDSAQGRQTCLYIADIGDNDLVRKRIQIYRIPEPTPGDAQSGRPEAFSAVYADGPQNAEALFVLSQDLFIVTRDRVGAVYKATANAAKGHDLVFERIGQLNLAAVTDAEASPDETHIVVRTSSAAVLYRTADFVRGVLTPFLQVPIDGLREMQGEGVALDGQTMYLASEGWPLNRGGRLLTLRCNWPPERPAQTAVAKQEAVQTSH